ncbi:hypothetical protein [Saccharothrix xinjiangensis]|uniref:DUF4259 domain-containing protein n=1 Tax=Saccharothrix xinjiangensis TaxID=204798 RepID=A0ABV9Y2X5_9PSEU
MGTWGTGNYEDDTAADHLSTRTSGLVEEIAEHFAGDPVGLEPDEYGGAVVPGAVELLCLIAEQGWVGATLPPAAVALEWKRRYLEVWDATIDDLGPSPEYRAGRREVLVATFDRLVALASR